MDEQERKAMIKSVRAKAKRIKVDESTRVDLIMAYECGEATVEQIVALFQNLVDTAWLGVFKVRTVAQRSR